MVEQNPKLLESFQLLLLEQFDDMFFSLITLTSYVGLYVHLF
jgi:hypothetical protein